MVNLLIVIGLPVCTKIPDIPAGSPANVGVKAVISSNFQRISCDLVYLGCNNC